MNLPRSAGGFADDAEPGALDRIRRQSHVHHIEQIKELAPELDVCPFETTASAALVQDAIDRLSSIYREVLVLRDIEELSTEETSLTLAISISSVNVRLHRRAYDAPERPRAQTESGNAEVVSVILNCQHV